MGGNTQKDAPIRASDEFLEVVRAFQGASFSNMREYGEALKTLRFAMDAERGRLINGPEGKYTSMASELCRQFAIDMFFNGEGWRTNSWKFRVILTKVKSAVSTYVHESCGISTQNPMFADEFERFKAKFEDVEEIRRAAWSRLTKPTQEYIQEIQKTDRW